VKKTTTLQVAEFADKAFWTPNLPPQDLSLGEFGHGERCSRTWKRERRLIGQLAFGFTNFGGCQGFFK
jgi:hypothetical protein